MINEDILAGKESSVSFLDTSFIKEELPNSPFKKGVPAGWGIY